MPDIKGALALIYVSGQLEVAALQSVSVVTSFSAPYVQICILPSSCVHKLTTLFKLRSWACTPSLTGILISRFLLHLQSASLRATGIHSQHGLATSHDMSAVFDRIVGALGASIAQDDYLTGEPYSGTSGDYMERDGLFEVELTSSSNTSSPTMQKDFSSTDVMLSY